MLPAPIHHRPRVRRDAVVMRLLDVLRPSTPNIFAKLEVWTSASSVSFLLAQETGRQLETRGDYVLAAEVLARALAQEALRINQRVLACIDLADEGAPEVCMNMTVSMARQREDLRNLRAPLLQREPSLLQRLCDSLAMRSAQVTASHSPSPPLATVPTGCVQELPRPTRTLDKLAGRWQLPRADVGSDDPVRHRQRVGRGV